MSRDYDLREKDAINHVTIEERKMLMCKILLRCKLHTFLTALALLLPYLTVPHVIPLMRDVIKALVYIDQRERRIDQGMY